MSFGLARARGGGGYLNAAEKNIVELYNSWFTIKERK